MTWVREPAGWAVFALVSCLFLTSGCDDEEAKAETIPAEVPLTAFCDHFDEIRCAGNAMCCADGAARFATVDECLGESACPAILAHAKVADGTITYDPAGASAYLRALESAATACGAPGADALPFLAGTIAEGGDCSPASEEEADLESAHWVCQPGLRCQIDAAGGSLAGSCAPANDEALGALGADCESDEACESGRCDADGLCAVGLADGEACMNGGDCESGVCALAGGATAECDDGGCTCAAEALYCAPPAEALEPPTNGSYLDAIVEMCVWAEDQKYKGTDDPVTLWLVGSDLPGVHFMCEIPGGVARGDKECCTAGPSRGEKRAGYTIEFGLALRVGGGSNGLGVTKFSVTAGDDMSGIFLLKSKSDMDDGTSTVNCSSCTFFGDENCDYCWVDSDGNGDCERLDINLNSGGYHSFSQVGCPQERYW